MNSASSVVCCTECGTVLTVPLLELIDESVISNEAGSDYIPRGYYVISDGGFFTNTKDQVIVNLKDAVNTKRHSDARRLNGCCGLDGCDGMNVLCGTGHEVGTERSDCWLPHAIHFDTNAVTIRTAVSTLYDRK
jgi:hypothetical protein